MQDDATPPTSHVSASTQRFLEGHDVSLLKWSACSPDCNSIEYSWGTLIPRVYAGGKCYDTVEELKDAVIAARDNLDILEIEEVQKFVSLSQSDLSKLSFLIE